MEFTRDTSVNANTGGDTVLQAILDLDHDLSKSFSGLNSVLRGAAFRINAAERAAAGGVCELGTDSKVPEARLPALDASKLPSGVSTPVGSIILWPAETPPSGWVECDGTKLDAATYAALFAVLGYTFGGSEDEGAFGIPDLRGQFVRGWSHGSGVDPDAYYRTSRGDGSYGDRVGTKQGSANLSHTHTVNGTTGQVDFGGAWFWPPSGSTTFDFIITDEGGAEGRPDNITLMWIIKAVA